MIQKKTRSPIESILFKSMVLTPLLIFNSMAKSAPLHPLLVHESSGDLSPEKSNEIISVIASSTQQALLTVMSKASYGNSDKVAPNRRQYVSEAEVSLDLLSILDDKLNISIGKLPSPGHGNRRLSFQMFWSDTNDGVSIVPGSLSDSLLKAALLHALIVQSVGPANAPIAGMVLASRASESKPELANHHQELAVERFDDIAAVAGKSGVVPIHLNLSYQIKGNEGVSVDYRILVSASKFESGPSDKGDAKILRTTYNPNLQGRGVVEISFNRTYKFQTDDKKTPSALVTFGQLTRKSKMRASSCLGDDCHKWLDALPTVHMETKDRKEWTLKSFGAWLAGFDLFQMMIRRVGINIRTYEMDPWKTELVFRTGAGGSHPKIIDVRRGIPDSWFEVFVQRNEAINKQILPSIAQSVNASIQSVIQTSYSKLLLEKYKEH